MPLHGNYWKYLEIEKTHYVISYVKCIYYINYGNKISQNGVFKNPKNPTCSIIIHIHTNYMIFYCIFSQIGIPKKRPI